MKQISPGRSYFSTGPVLHSICPVNTHSCSHLVFQRCNRCSPADGFLNLLKAAFICIKLFFSQVIWVSGDRTRLWLFGQSSEVKPLTSERVGPELQPSRRIWREEALWAEEWSTIPAQPSQVMFSFIMHCLENGPQAQSKHRNTPGSCLTSFLMDESQLKMFC